MGWVAPACAGNTAPALMASLRLRITPACAGNTSHKRIDKASDKDHPRVCGEHKKDELCWQAMLCFAIAVVLVIFGIGVTVNGIFAPLQANKELREFENTRQIVEQVASDATALENIAITSKIIESNSWLAAAKASKSQWGRWSDYYFIDFDNIEPIQVPR